jgi:hypothetical protein
MIVAIMPTNPCFNVALQPKRMSAAEPALCELAAA